MTPERYKEIDEYYPFVKITTDEWNEGWHFCDEWDGLLVGPGMGEFAACQCSGLTLKAAKNRTEEEIKMNRDMQNQRVSPADETC